MRRYFKNYQMHKYSPFWQSALKDNMDFFKGQTETRYSLCQKACQMLLLEFFADEEGNIVVKIPNWVLGANYLQANNCNIRYYDDLNFYKPNFYQNSDGSLGVEASSGVEESSSGGGGLGGFLGAIFGGIMDALNGIFSTIFSGKDDEERIIKEPNSDVSDTNPNRDIAKFIENVKKTLKRKEEAEKKAEKKGGLLGPFQDAFNNLSNLLTFEHTEQEIDNTDYSYAGITDKIINDAINKDNENVIQVDEYKIKVKVSTIHDDKFGSLYSLAKYCYNNPYKWHLIAELNDIYEPTEIKEGQWLEIYSNEPISDFIVNSSSIDSLELQELKYLRKLRLQNLYKTNDNEITVCNRPFIKGEFISFPRSLRSTQKKINFSKKYKTTLPNKKKFFIPKNKISNIDNKIIHCNEADIDKIIKASAYINNGYLLSDYDEQYDSNTNTWKITLTIPQDINEESMDENYSLLNYQPDSLYNVILTIKEDQETDDVNDDKYILSSYQENKKSNGDTEVILTILDTKEQSKIPKKPGTVMIDSTPIKYANDVDHSITEQEKDPEDKLHPKHGYSITEKRIQEKEVPKTIPKDRIKEQEQAEEDSSQTPQHDIPPQQQEQEGQVTDNTGPDKDYYRNTERAAKERSSQAKAVSQRLSTLGDSQTKPREVDITEEDSEEKPYERPERMFRAQRTDLDIIQYLNQNHYGNINIFKIHL